MDNKYRFYMQWFKVGGVEMPIRDLESDFEGLIYSKLSGIDKYGKIKNQYTETYAESSQLRVFIPDIITRENPSLELTLYFTGENRRLVYHSFVEYVSGHKLIYWDTCRNRRVSMILNGAIEPSDEKLYGSVPYFEVPFPFLNLDGESEIL